MTLLPTGYVVTTLRPCTRGANKRGICGHKRTKAAKRAKRQDLPGSTPYMTTTTTRLL